MGIESIKSRRGQGELWDESKTEQANLYLTKKGKLGLARVASSLLVSRSEMLELIARGIIKVEIRPDSLAHVLQDRNLDVISAATSLPLDLLRAWASTPLKKLPEDIRPKECELGILGNAVGIHGDILVATCNSELERNGGVLVNDA
jgi:hypothetical protein